MAISGIVNSHASKSKKTVRFSIKKIIISLIAAIDYSGVKRYINKPIGNEQC